MRHGNRPASQSDIHVPVINSLDLSFDPEVEDSEDEDRHVPLSPSLDPARRKRSTKRRISISVPRYRRRWLLTASLACFVLLLFSTLTGRSEQPLQEIDTGKAIVIASYTIQDLSWTKSVPADWTVHRYNLDDPNPHHPNSITRNQGREATAYLSFIIEHYHALPDYVVFVHGHESAWHQVEHMGAKIAALNLTALDNDKYISMRCVNKPGCTSDTLIDFDNLWWEPIGYLRDFWQTVMPDEPMPEYIGASCCGQFAVSKDAILSRPFDFWLALRAPLRTDMSILNATWSGNGTVADVDNYAIGMMYEWTWHIIFGKDSVHCHTEDYCRRVQFSDAIQCDRYVEMWSEQPGLSNITCTFDFYNGIHDSEFIGDRMLDSYQLIENIPPDMGRAQQQPPIVQPTTEEEEDS